MATQEVVPGVEAILGKQRLELAGVGDVRPLLQEAGRGDRHLVVGLQGLAQRSRTGLAGKSRRGRELERVQQGLDHGGIVARLEAERVAWRVAQPRTRQRELDVTGFLARSAAGEDEVVEDGRLKRIALVMGNDRRRRAEPGG